MITNLLACNNLEIFGAVAQLVRASDCRSEGCAFESRRPRFVAEGLPNSYVCRPFGVPASNHPLPIFWPPTMRISWLTTTVLSLPVAILSMCISGKSNSAIVRIEHNSYSNLGLFLKVLRGKTSHCCNACASKWSHLPNSLRWTNRRTCETIGLGSSSEMSDNRRFSTD